MYRKPWPIVILALLHFMEPLVKLIFYSILWKMPVSSFLTYMQYQATPFELFLFLGAFPLAGVAILAVKRWSVPAFLAIQGLNVAGNIYYHIVAPKTFPTELIVGVCLLNLALTVYFLLPAVRMTYLDAKVRWWESKPRFLVDWKAKITQGKSYDVRIANISEGGVYFICDKGRSIDVDEPLKVDFGFLNMRFSLTARVRHHNASGEAKHFGIQFVDVSPAQKMSLRRCVGVLRALEFERLGVHEDSWASFVHWLRTLISTGHGLVPEVKRLPEEKSHVTVGSRRKK